MKLNRKLQARPGALNCLICDQTFNKNKVSILFWIGALMLILLSGCDSDKSTRKALKKMCKDHASLEIIKPDMWQQYIQSLLDEMKILEQNKNSQKEFISYLSPPAGYSYVSTNTEDVKLSSTQKPGEIRKDIIYIKKNNVKFVKFVNFGAMLTPPFSPGYVTCSSEQMFQFKNPYWKGKV